MIVIDSSVVFKWFDESEANSEQALQILQSHLSKANKENSIVVPDLILYEVSNAWSTKSLLRSEVIIDNLRLLKSYSLKIINMDFSLLGKAVLMSKKYHVSVYDAVYAVLAEEKKCLLVTADKKFVEKISEACRYAVNLSFVKLLEAYK